MKITVKDLTGKQALVEVSNNETVKDLKLKIHSQSGTADQPFTDFDLVFDGKVLENDKKVTEERLRDGVSLHLLASDLSKVSTTQLATSPTGTNIPVGKATSPINSPVKSPPTDAYINTGVRKVDYNQSIFQLNANLWDVRSFKGGNIVVDKASMAQSVFIQDCLDTRVEITSKKVNRILIDRCINTTIYVNSVISRLEIVNCENVDVHASGNIPTVQVDLTRGVNVHLLSTTEGLTNTRFVNASCLEFFIILEDKGLKFQVPTSMLQDQLVSRISVHDEDDFQLKSLPSETMKKGGYVNMSLLDSVEGMNAQPNGK